METTTTYMFPYTMQEPFYRESAEIAAWRPKRNTTSQATIRREIRRRSNLPKAVQRRLGFKCK